MTRHGVRTLCFCAAVTAMAVGLVSCREAPALETDESKDSVSSAWQVSVLPPPSGDSETAHPYVAYDSSPEVLHRVEPVIPDSLLSAVQDSTVFVKVRVDTAGRPTEVEGLRGDSLLLPYACEAVERWSFVPAKCRGIPIYLDIVVRVEFGQSLPE